MKNLVPLLGLLAFIVAGAGCAAYDSADDCYDTGGRAGSVFDGVATVESDPLDSYPPATALEPSPVE